MAGSGFWHGSKSTAWRNGHRPTFSPSAHQPLRDRARIVEWQTRQTKIQCCSSSRLERAGKVCGDPRRCPSHQSPARRAWDSGSIGPPPVQRCFFWAFSLIRGELRPKLDNAMRGVIFAFVLRVLSRQSSRAAAGLRHQCHGAFCDFLPFPLYLPRGRPGLGQHRGERFCRHRVWQPRADG